jgi:hypothetical protein
MKKRETILFSSLPCLFFFDLGYDVEEDENETAKHRIRRIFGSGWSLGWSPLSSRPKRPFSHLIATSTQNLKQKLLITA